MAVLDNSFSRIAAKIAEVDKVILDVIEDAKANGLDAGSLLQRQNEIAKAFKQMERSRPKLQNSSYDDILQVFAAGHDNLSASQRALIHGYEVAQLTMSPPLKQSLRNLSWSTLQEWQAKRVLLTPALDQEFAARAASQASEREKSETSIREAEPADSVPRSFEDEWTMHRSELCDYAKKLVYEPILDPRETARYLEEASNLIKAHRGFLRTARDPLREVLMPDSTDIEWDNVTFDDLRSRT